MRLVHLFIIMIELTRIVFKIALMDIIKESLLIAKNAQKSAPNVMKKLCAQPVQLDIIIKVIVLKNALKEQQLA